jgi:hypothetical protein
MVDLKVMDGLDVPTKTLAKLKQRTCSISLGKRKGQVSRTVMPPLGNNKTSYVICAGCCLVA